ncbi:hypothetical protein DH2020_015940 [Rehmannia glutinosa]|uniref:Uncharacterized protein n=1 Tax=Rehmannia glutinosa TaxID=99300 RepID=A0ABR0WVP6_REHGL
MANRKVIIVKAAASNSSNATSGSLGVVSKKFQAPSEITPLLGIAEDESLQGNANKDRSEELRLVSCVFIRRSTNRVAHALAKLMDYIYVVAIDFSLQRFPGEMQKENVSFDALTTTTSAAGATSSLHFSRSNPFLSPTSPANYLNSNSFYSSLFQNYSPTSLSDTASFDGGGDTERRLHDASSVLEYQQLYNRYALCLSQLRESIEEVDALRSENDSLRLSNADLSHRVALLFSRDRLLSEFNRLNIASPSAAPAPLPVRAAHPQPLTEHNRFDRRNTE